MTLHRERFADRAEAGRDLAEALDRLRGEPLIVLALPRGGVPVGFEVAQVLQAPLDVVVVRKLGVPSRPELAMGAIGEGGVWVVDTDVVRLAGVTPRQLADVAGREHAELDRRARQYRGVRPPLPIAGRTVVIVDDGLATGSTARAACRTVRAGGAARVVLAVPVAPPGWTDRLDGEADEYVTVKTPADLYAVGQTYQDFSQVSDAEVRTLLVAAAGVTPHEVG